MNEEIKTLAQMEEEYINYVLKLCFDDKTKAAKLLGIGRATMYRKIAQYKREREMHSEQIRGI